MAERKSASVPRLLDVERAASNIISIADNEERKSTPSGYATYTSMYKQHPIVRSAIDKLAKQSVANGYSFTVRDKKLTHETNEAAIVNLNAIFARSKAQALLRSTYTDLLIYGDAYWWITKSRLGVPYAFLRQNPSTVSVVIDKETREVTSYIVRDAQGNELQYDPTDFLHFKLFDPDNEVYGLSLLESLKSTVAQDLFAQTYNEAFFANSAQTGIVFNMRNASKEEVERNREFLKKEYVSARNAHKPLLLEGDVEVGRSVALPAEMQFIDGRKHLLQEILAVFDLPYTKLGGSMESANRSQSAENDKSFRAEAIVPLQGVIEEVINEDFILLILKVEDTIFAHEEVDYRDEKEKSDIWITLLEHGVLAINEVRSQMGLPDVDGGDIPYINTSTGIVAVKNIEQAAELDIEAKEAAVDNAEKLAKAPVAPPGGAGASSRPPKGK